jgi:multidrug efflux system membrane fusion protein
MRFGIDRRWAVALLALAFVGGCKKPPPPVVPPQPVVFALAEKRSVDRYIETFGNCVTVASVTVRPQVTGILKQTFFEEGAEVSAGDLLFEIDPAPFQAAVTQAEGDLKTAQGALLLAQQNLDRQSKLYATEVTDIQDLQTAQANTEEAVGNVTSAEGALEQARINLGYCRIASPIAGKTGPYLINTGNVVEANKGELVNVRTISPIYVSYTISENQMVDVQKYLDPGGLDVEITIPGAPDYKSLGKLTFLDNSIASGTGTLQLRATMANEDRALWPGLFVNVRLILMTIPDAIVVPVSSVLTGQQGPHVFVVNQNDTVSLRLVQMGQREGEMIIVTEGLQPGERVVVSGQLALADGKKVVPKPQAAPAGAKGEP